MAFYFQNWISWHPQQAILTILTVLALKPEKSLFGVSKSKTGHPKNCMQNCKLRYWQKAHYQENMVDIPVPQNGLQMAIKKKKKPLRIQTKFSHHSKELSAPLKTTERLHFHGLLLPNRRQWIKALNPSVLFDLGNETKHWHLNMTRSEILQSLYFGSGFPLLATESYTLSSAKCSEVEELKWVQENGVDGGWGIQPPA